MAEDKKLKEMIRQIVKEEMAIVRKELVDKLNFIQKNMAAQVEKQTEKQVEEANNKQLALMRQDVNNQVNEQILSTFKANIVPQMRQFARMVEEKTLDGTEMVTNYRKQVVGQGQKSLTSGDKKLDFQASIFVFTDND